MGRKTKRGASMVVEVLIPSTIKCFKVKTTSVSENKLQSYIGSFIITNFRMERESSDSSIMFGLECQVYQPFCSENIISREYFTIMYTEMKNLMNIVKDISREEIITLIKHINEHDVTVEKIKELFTALLNQYNDIPSKILFRGYLIDIIVLLIIHAKIEICK